MTARLPLGTIFQSAKLTITLKEGGRSTLCHAWNAVIALQSSHIFLAAACTFERGPTSAAGACTELRMGVARVLPGSSLCHRAPPRTLLIVPLTASDCY
jgi:hypothetical protein